ncbi:Uncharacterised protein [Bordetella pertussis]|nr:Uncharacterised protein [Bordetella pertussis]
MWVCSTQALPATWWMAAWMNMAVGSTSWRPASLLPAASTSTMSSARTSDHISPRGLSRKAPAWPGSATLK